MQDAIALLTNDIPADPPGGFRSLPTGPGFNLLMGPIWGRVEGLRLVLGMRVGHRHINPHQTCHGGVLSVFADFMAYAVQHEADEKNTLTPTVSTTIDFLSPAVRGDWLEGRCELLRRTRNLLFCQTVARVGDRPVFRSSSIFKIGKPVSHVGSTLGSFFDAAAE